MDPEIEVTSTAKGLETEATLTSATEDPEIKVPQGTSSSGTIFHAPVHIRYGQESDFEPRLVSIGPYHHGRENLYPMEVTKTQFMSDLLKMSVDENQSYLILDQNLLSQKKKGPSHIDCVPIDPFMKFGRRARSFYKEKFDHSDVDFVRMLVLDSCFIIRIILCLSLIEQVSMPLIDMNIKVVRSDLLLLENQIPLFFVKEVYGWFLRFNNLDSTNFSPFESVLESFICLDMPWRINPHGLSNRAAHLLDLYWKCSVSPKLNKELNNILKHRFKKVEQRLAQIVTTTGSQEIANATVLHEKADINFEKRSDVGLHVTFSNGVLRMPCLKIDSSQINLLVNLVAFESSMLPRIRNITCYVKLMDTLIHSEKDVELLEQCGVIYNTLSSHKKAATFFHDIGNLCFIDYNAFIFSDLYDNVRKHCKSRWARRHNYFNRAYAVYAAVAGVTLLILTTLQTFYTIYGYYNPMN